MISRRSFILGASAVLAPNPVIADIKCSGFNGAGVSSCIAGLRNVPFVQQRCRQWCWAACSEMAFRTQGFDVDQRAFVQKLFNGPLRCEPATGPSIAQAVSGRWRHRNGNLFRANFNVIMDVDYGVQNHPAPLDVVKRELIQDRLAIAGTLGHAICITAMEFYRDQTGREQLISLIVRDPYPRSGNRYRMSPQQFNNGRLLATISFS